MTGRLHILSMPHKALPPTRILSPTKLDKTKSQDNATTAQNFQFSEHRSDYSNVSNLGHVACYLISSPIDKKYEN